MKKLRVAPLLLAVVLLFAACSSGGGSEPVEKATFSDPETGVAFEYPSNWVEGTPMVAMNLENVCIFSDSKEEDATFDMETLNIGDGFVVAGRSDEDVKAMADMMFGDMTGPIADMTAELESQGVKVESAEASPAPVQVQRGGATFYEVTIEVAVSAGLRGDAATFTYSLGYANDRLFYIMAGSYSDQGEQDLAELFQSLRFDAAE